MIQFEVMITFFPEEFWKGDPAFTCNHVLPCSATISSVSLFGRGLGKEVGACGVGEDAKDLEKSWIFPG